MDTELRMSLDRLRESIDALREEIEKQRLITGAGAGAGAGSDGLVERLHALSRLARDHLISEDEYDERKNELLRRWSG
jgi:hypothetical protein